MSRIDITNENLCIKKIITVVKGQNLNHHKLLTVSGRHSDAFVYIIFGSCTYRFDDKIEFTANAGDVVYLPYQSVYTLYIHTTDYQFVFCDFEFAEDRARHGSHYPSQSLKKVDSLFMRLLHNYRSSSRNRYTECMSVIYGIYNALQQSVDPLDLNKNKKDIIAQTKLYMDETFHDADLSISALAEKAGISEVYFRKLFKAKYGISPARYLMAMRLKNAKKLMKYPFLTLEECALQSGFSSVQYFCRLFKKEMGISPGKYKKEPLL